MYLYLGSLLGLVMRLFGRLAANFLALESHLFGWSVLDYATFCPMVFSAVVLVAFAICNGPSIVADAVGLLRGGLRIVSKSTISSIYSQDGVLGVVRHLLTSTRAMFRQSWAYRWYCWLELPEEVQFAAIPLLPVAVAVCSYKFAIPIFSYARGIFSAVVNDSGSQSVVCHYHGRTFITLEYHRKRDIQLLNLFCDGERDGYDIMAGWREAKESHLYNWEMFQPVAFAWVLAALCLATFVSWMAAKSNIADSVGMWLVSLTDMIVSAEPIPHKNDTGAQVGTSVEPESTGYHAASNDNDNVNVIDKESDMIRQLIGRNRELESRALVDQSTITHLEGEVQLKDQELDSVRKANKEVHAGLSSSLALAQGQFHQEKVTKDNLQERHGALRALADVIADSGACQYLLGFDKLELGCDEATPGSGISTGQPIALREEFSNQFPTLLKEASEEASVTRQVKREEWHSAKHHVVSLGRKLQKSRRYTRSLTAKLTRNLNRRHSQVDSIKRTTATLDATRLEHASIVAGLETQLSEQRLAVVALESQRSELELAVTESKARLSEKAASHESRSGDVGVEVAVGESVEDVRAAKDKEIEAIREKVENMQNQLRDRNQEILYMDKLLLRKSIQLSESEALNDKTADALSRAEEEIKALPIRESIAEEHETSTMEDAATDDNTAQLQQQLANSDARASALCEELDHVNTTMKQQQGEFEQWRHGIEAQGAQMTQQHAATLAQRDADRRHIHDLQVEGQKLLKEVSELRKYREKMRGTLVEQATLSNAQVKVLEQEKEIQGLQQQLAHSRHLSQLNEEQLGASQSQQAEKLRTRVQALERSQATLTNEKGDLIRKLTDVKGELQKAKISESNKTTPITNPRMVRKPNPLQGKVDALQKELEQTKSQLVETTKEKDQLAEAVRSRPGSTTEPEGEGNPPKTCGKRRRDDAIDEESAPKRHKDFEGKD